MHPILTAHLATPDAHQVGVRLGHLHVIDDARRRHVQRAHARGVGFEFAQPFGADHFQPFDPVGRAAAMEFLQPRQFIFRRSHDDLAAAFVWNVVPIAEVGQQLSAPHARLGLERAGLVIDAGVDDSAVVAGLMRRQPVLFFEHARTNARILAGDFQGGRQAENATADHTDVIRVGHTAAVLAEVPIFVCV